MTCVVVVSHRSAERRRSSLVVSLPGLEVFPGDLLVSDSAMDYLPYSSFLLSAGQTQGGVCSSEPSRSRDWNMCACGMGGRMYTMRTWSGADSVGYSVTPHQSDCIANFKIPLFFFPPPPFYCWMQNASRWQGRTQITLLLHRLGATRAQARISICMQLSYNFLPPQLQAETKVANAPLCSSVLITRVGDPTHG